MEIEKKKNEEAQRETSNSIDLFADKFNGVIKYLDKYGKEFVLVDKTYLKSILDNLQTSSDLQIVTNNGSTTTNTISIQSEDTGIDQSQIQIDHTTVTIYDSNGSNTISFIYETGGVEAVYLRNKYGDINPYSIYSARIEQDGTTSAPIATIQQNQLFDVITWTRLGVGKYRGTLAAVFTVGKTFCEINMGLRKVGTEVTCDFLASSLNSIDLSIYQADGITAVDGFKADIEIRIYS